MGSRFPKVWVSAKLPLTAIDQNPELHVERDEIRIIVWSVDVGQFHESNSRIGKGRLDSGKMQT